MIPAKEAFAHALENQVDSIEKLIIEKVKEGKVRLIYPDCLYTQTIRELETAGYRVFKEREDYYTIFW
jgi:hypothetical protein